MATSVTQTKSQLHELKAWLKEPLIGEGKYLLRDWNDVESLEYDDTLLREALLFATDEKSRRYSAVMQAKAKCEFLGIKTDPVLHRMSVGQEPCKEEVGQMSTDVMKGTLLQFGAELDQMRTEIDELISWQMRGKKRVT